VSKGKDLIQKSQQNGTYKHNAECSGSSSLPLEEQHEATGKNYYYNSASGNIVTPVYANPTTYMQAA